MKLNTTLLPVETSVQNATQAFSIKTTAKAFKILSDGLYKNKILAFVRELSRNAYDAHIAAGRKNVPFEIHLPNMLEPWFHVKDFGTGLSHENVLHLYTTYFESTKQDSNDFVGALGLGSKSPFSYVTSFTVKSRFDGIESTYTCFLSEAGVPSIVKMGEGKYTGFPGLEVVIPIEKNDFAQVKGMVNQDLAFWEGTLPSVVGDSLFKLTPPSKTIIGKGWYTTGRDRSVYPSVPVAVQGNVGYPVSVDLLRAKVRDDLERAALDIIKRLNPVIFFEIGKLDVTASREELSYDDPTIRNIIEAIVKVVDEFGIKFKEEIIEVTKETTELAFRSNARALVTKYQDAYGSEFIRFFSAKVSKISWNKIDFTLTDLLKTDKYFFIEGRTPVGMFHVTKRWRGNGNRLKKNVHGNVIVFESKKNVTLANVEKEMLNSRAYGDYRSFEWWDVNKKVLPRRPRDAKASYEQLIASLSSSSKNAPSVFTSWRFDMFGKLYNGGKVVIFLNDQQTFGYDIVSQYIEENKNDQVYVLDYNKRHVSSKTVSDFIKKFTEQLSGLKILSTSQLVLKNPIVKQPRAKRNTGPVRNVNDVTYFVRDTSANSNSVEMHAKSLGYGSHATKLTFRVEHLYKGTEEAIDFSQGDFYYFYERHNKMYLDEKYTRRVAPMAYLNALNFLGFIPSNVKFVGLKPVQIRNILKSKTKGKLIPIAELDAKFLDNVRQNTLLVQANVIGKAGVVNGSFSGPINDLFTCEEMLRLHIAKYGEYKLANGKTGVKLFDELADVFAVGTISENEGLRKIFTVLETIRYYSDGTDRSYRDAWLTVFKDVNVDNEVAKLKKKINECVNNFYNKYPLLQAVTATDYRYDSKRLEKKQALIDNLIEYVNFKNGKKH